MGPVKPERAHFFIAQQQLMVYLIVIILHKRKMDCRKAKSKLKAAFDKGSISTNTAT